MEQKEQLSILMSILIPKKDGHLYHGMLASMLCSICKRKLGYEVEVVVQHKDFGYCHKSCYDVRLNEDC